MTEYHEGWPYPVALAAEHPATTLSAVIATTGGRQLHVAEHALGEGAKPLDPGERKPPKGDVLRLCRDAQPDRVCLAIAAQLHCQRVITARFRT